jgi:transcriptional regulator with XRE-family HTH domain
MPKRPSANPSQPHSTRDLVPGFAKLVLRARESHGWTVLRLAQEAGVCATTASAVEREVRAPSLRVAMLLARALSIRVLLSDPADPKKVDALMVREK